MIHIKRRGVVGKYQSSRQKKSSEKTPRPVSRKIWSVSSACMQITVWSGFLDASYHGDTVTLSTYCPGGPAWPAWDAPCCPC